MPYLLFAGWLEIPLGICNLVSKHVMKDGQSRLARQQLASKGDRFGGWNPKRSVHCMDRFLIEIDEVFDVND